MTLTIGGTTSITGNTNNGTSAPYDGGGAIQLYDGGFPVSLDFLGNAVSITGNSCGYADCGPAIYVYRDSSTVTVTGASNVTISSNTPTPQCVKYDGSSTAVPDCSSF